MKQCSVALTPEEPAGLEALTTKGTCKARKLKRARVLLAADDGDPDAVIAAKVRIHVVTDERLRKRCVAEGLEAALDERPAPAGRARWTGSRRATCWLWPAPRRLKAGSAGRGGCWRIRWWN